MYCLALFAVRTGSCLSIRKQLFLKHFIFIYSFIKDLAGFSASEPRNTEGHPSPKSYGSYKVENIGKNSNQ